MNCPAEKPTNQHNQTMASLELARLWKLHLVDSAIHDIRHRAATLDPGKAAQGAVDKLVAEEPTRAGEFHQLHGEQLDLELANKTVEDKLKRYEKDLYGGKIVNAREVENVEKEMTILRRQRDKNDERLLELMDLVPPAKKRADAYQAELDRAKAALADARKKAKELRAKLEADYAENTKLRPERAKVISPALLAKYEALRQKHTTGMAEVIKFRNCGGCGMVLAERVLVALQEDKVATCDACHRILYWTEGVV
jgi:predicted  nucleic acid-binding Zn-ribbon protein